jgi:hypothetical protein
MLFASESRTAAAAAKQNRQYAAKSIAAKPAISALIFIAAKAIAAAAKQ